MAENLYISKTATKQEAYESLVPQIKALIDGEEDLIANLANISSALKMAFGFFWVGFYLVKKDELVLGPFQGTIACTRIKKGKGVCGHSWQEMKTVVVPDVDAFPGHIACSSDSKSEIVIPHFNVSNEVDFILDVDSDKLNDFDQTDELYLKKIVELIKSGE